MKRLSCIFSLFCVLSASSQVENIIIITTDGFRWQEVFKGMDSSLAMNPAFDQNESTAIFSKYWASTQQERCRKLMPFLWDSIASKGQLYGNRNFDNYVNNSNPYWFSYPGYSEIFCGFADKKINSNDFPPNPHTNLLEYLNKKKEFKGKVAAFGAWDAFDRILNEKRSGFPVVCGIDSCGGEHPNRPEQLLNRLKQITTSPFGKEEYPDTFTHLAAMEYLKNNKPRVLYIGYGETDEWAHMGRYADYLDAAHRVDKWIAEIWNFVQSDPQYKNKTALFITVDHGRGEGEQWTGHSNKIPGSDQIWFAVMGPQVISKGEIKTDGQLYQKQFAKTISGLLGRSFCTRHRKGKSFLKMLIQK